jgi:hypothetical protein
MYHPSYEDDFCQSWCGMGDCECTARAKRRTRPSPAVSHQVIDRLSEAVALLSPYADLKPIIAMIERAQEDLAVTHAQSHLLGLL